MTELEKKNFTAVDICKIVKACAESKVFCLQLGDLKVDFRLPDIATEEDIFLGQARPEEIQRSNEKAEKIAAFELLSENQKFEDDAIDHLMITDPHQYEHLLSQGDLENEEA